MAINDDKKKLHILLAEDNTVSQKLAIALLEKTGHTVCVVDSGEKAVSAFKNGGLDLIIMDIQMPDMDGFTATKEIRNSKEPNLNNQIPIIGLTAYFEPEDRQRAFDEGMNEYLTKPLRAKEFFAALRRFE